MPKPKSFYIIDGHAQIYRAFFAPFRDLSSPTGEPTKVTNDGLGRPVVREYADNTFEEIHYDGARVDFTRDRQKREPRQKTRARARWGDATAAASGRLTPT